MTTSLSLAEGSSASWVVPGPWGRRSPTEATAWRWLGVATPFPAAKPAVTQQVYRLHLGASLGEAHSELVGVAGRA